MREVRDCLFLRKPHQDRRSPPCIIIADGMIPHIQFAPEHAPNVHLKHIWASLATTTTYGNRLTPGPPSCTTPNPSNYLICRSPSLLPSMFWTLIFQFSPRDALCCAFCTPLQMYSSRTDELLYAPRNWLWSLPLKLHPGPWSLMMLPRSPSRLSLGM